LKSYSALKFVRFFSGPPCISKFCIKLMSAGPDEHHFRRLLGVPNRTTTSVRLYVHPSPRLTITQSRHAVWE